MTHDRTDQDARSFASTIFVGLVLLLTCFVYWPGLGGGFLFDDFPNIVENRLLQVDGGEWTSWLSAAFSSPASDLQRPLAMLTFAINVYFTGLDPWWMKLTNLAIHIINGSLALGLVRTLVRLQGSMGRRGEWAALFVMATWLLNPINFTPILLIVQRMELLSHSFVFASLWLYSSGRAAQREGRTGWSRILFALLLVAPLGILAKESAVLVPLYAFILELVMLDFRLRSGAPRDLGLLKLYALLAVPALAAGFWAFPRAFGAQAYVSRNFDLVERLLTESRVLVDYLQWTVLPRLNVLSLHHDDYVVSRGVLDPPATLLSILGLVALAAVAWNMRRRRPLATLGIAWFLAGHLLTATVLPLELVFEHRNYFASLGLCIALGDVLILAYEDSSRWRRPAAMVAGLLLAVYTGTTFARSAEWSDPVRLASSEASKNPRSARAAYDWARTLVILSDYDPNSRFTSEALAAVDRASRLPGSGILPEQAGLVLASRAGVVANPDWWPAMYVKLRSNPVGPQERGAIAAMTKCSVARDCSFPDELMVGLFAAALHRGPDPEVLNIFGDYALNVMSDPDLALRLWADAIELDPRQAQYRINSAKLLAVLGRRDEAKVQIEALRKLGRFGQYEPQAKAIEARIAQPGPQL